MEENDIYQFEDRSVFQGYWSNFALNIIDCKNSPRLPDDLENEIKMKKYALEFTNY